MSSHSDFNLKDKYLAFLKARENYKLRRSDIFNVPYNLLRDGADISFLRSNGIFFSSEKVGKQLLRHLDQTSSKRTLDPCCGAGDLLLCYADTLPIGKNQEDTLQLWENHLYGNDLFQNFIDVAKIRLLLLVSYKTSPSTNIRDIDFSLSEKYFKYITTGDALQKRWSDIELVLLNPPFQLQNFEKKYPWGKGRISSSAVFLYEYYKNYGEYCNILAILPDVLRSGTRYKSFREHLDRFNWKMACVYGRFDKKTDIDVFTISLTLTVEKKKRAHESQTKIEDVFDVHVGPVVPHRDSQEGKEFYFLYTKNLPPWGEIKTSRERVKSTRTTYKGPFIAIRRTSSPTDKYRCIATLISSKKSFAVENHVILLLPKDKKQQTCRALLPFLHSEKCNEIVNKNIRCRHLTVKVIKELPYIKLGVEK